MEKINLDNEKAMELINEFEESVLEIKFHAVSSPQADIAASEENYTKAKLALLEALTIK